MPKAFLNMKKTECSGIGNDLNALRQNGLQVRGKAAFILPQNQYAGIVEGGIPDDGLGRIGIIEDVHFRIGFPGQGIQIIHGFRRIGIAQKILSGAYMQHMQGKCGFFCCLPSFLNEPAAIFLHRDADQHTG